jgi:cytochrome c oxidase assembly protein subunit 11
VDLRQRSQANRKLIRRLAFTALGMFGFGFALVPLYNVFCDITGLNGKTGGAIDAVAASSSPVDKSRLITVEFLSAVESGLPWDFRPVTTKMQVHPGEIHETHYIARNRSDHKVVGQAIPSVAPGSAAKYFNKIECFCFTEQTLAGGEERLMAVRFVLDPELPAAVSTVTLSYTFFESTTNEQQENILDSGLPPISRRHVASDMRNYQ